MLRKLRFRQKNGFFYKKQKCSNITFANAIKLVSGLLVLQTVGPTQQHGYRYCGQEECAVSSIFCRTIDTLVKTSVSLVLLFVGISTH